MRPRSGLSRGSTLRSSRSSTTPGTPPPSPTPTSALRKLLPRERKKQEYLDTVKERYKHLPEVKRIVMHRHLPKPIYKAANLTRTMIEAENRKEERRRAHSARGSMPVQPFRKRRIIEEVE